MSTFWQLPAVLGLLLHVWQAGQLGTAQQTPSTQARLAHSSAPKQLWPFGLGPHELVALQTLGAQQSAAPPQATTHALPRHFAGPQVFDAVAGALHAPRPSHALANVCVEVPAPSAQVCAAHSVPPGHRRHAPLPSQKPSVWQVERAVSAHRAEGPTGTELHVPTEPATAQDWQAPVHAELQQTPCAQTADTHSAFPPHVCPFGLRPHRPEAALQTFGATQSAALVAGAQLALQAVPPHLNEPHVSAAGVVQAPTPSHVDAAVDMFVATLQLGSLQTVPFAYRWQTPAWHLPVVPQVPLPMSLQTPAGSALPVGTLVHRPFVAASAHDWHDPLHAELQHTPCAQKPEAHSVPPEHDAPGGFGPHRLSALQTRGVTQFSFTVHALKQAVPLQTYGLQGTASGASQAPLALHVDGAV